MSDPLRQSPLARLGLAARAGDADAPVRLGWAQPAAMALLRGDPPVGLVLPAAPNTVAEGPVRALWLGPDEWLLSGAVDIAALAAGGARVVDVSHARAVLTIAGDYAVDLLAKACPLDLHPDAFPAGGCAQTRFARISALLHRRGDARFDVYVGRSYAVYAWQWLADAAAEFGYAVAGLDQFPTTSE